MCHMMQSRKIMSFTTHGGKEQFFAPWEGTQWANGTVPEIQYDKKSKTKCVNWAYCVQNYH